MHKWRVTVLAPMQFEIEAWTADIANDVAIEAAQNIYTIQAGLLRPTSRVQGVPVMRHTCELLTKDEAQPAPEMMTRKPQHPKLVPVHAPPPMAA